jgi:hypothetical protein
MRLCDTMLFQIIIIFLYKLSMGNYCILVEFNEKISLDYINVYEILFYARTTQI